MVSVTPTPIDRQRSDKLRGGLYRLFSNFDQRMSLESVRTRDTERSLPRHNSPELDMENAR
jgi:hypothetical protein